jgi:NAD(P)-dependent dehydrogenase (short-subunit alcohol dehydrogenase family)
MRTGRLAGKRVLITGAGGAMGADVARAFAAEGADLVLTTRTVAKLDPLARELGAQGSRVVTVAADFTRDADVDRLADAAWDAFGGLDVVLLSSQPSQPNQGALLEVSEEALIEQQRAIAWGPLRLLRRLAPAMIEARIKASIIAVTSSTGIEQPVAGYGAYGIAKGTLWIMIRQMAVEWGRHGIRCNAFQPGHVATGDDVDAAALETALKANGALRANAMGRVGRNAECMGALIHLASDESSYTTGQRLIVNGGRI